jgi:hypothetical protein
MPGDYCESPLRGGGRSVNGKGKGRGPEGMCECSACGTKIKHSPGQPCYLQKCPGCGGAMTRPPFS